MYIHKKGIQSTELLVVWTMCDDPYLGYFGMMIRDFLGLIISFHFCWRTLGTRPVFSQTQIRNWVGDWLYNEKHWVAIYDSDGLVGIKESYRRKHVRCCWNMPHIWFLGSFLVLNCFIEQVAGGSAKTWLLYIWMDPRGRTGYGMDLGLWLVKTFECKQTQRIHWVSAWPMFTSRDFCMW